MSTIWAYCIGTFAPPTGRWEANSDTGWSNNIAFSSLLDLNSKLQNGGFKNKVTRLGIVAHGNSPGTVKLDVPDLTSKTIANHKENLELLASFFNTNEEVFLIFFSCIAGVKQDGTNLLLGLSNIFKGITIVGFTAYGAIGSSGFPNSPGNIIAFENQSYLQTGKAYTIDDRGKDTHRPTILSPWGPFAKWALNGTITKLPVDETRSSATTVPGFYENNLTRKVVHYCANIRCPGHKSAFDRCW